MARLKSYWALLCYKALSSASRRAKARLLEPPGPWRLEQWKNIMLVLQVPGVYYMDPRDQGDGRTLCWYIRFLAFTIMTREIKAMEEYYVDASDSLFLLL